MSSKVKVGGSCVLFNNQLFIHTGKHVNETNPSNEIYSLDLSFSQSKLNIKKLKMNSGLPYFAKLTSWNSKLIAIPETDNFVHFYDQGVWQRHTVQFPLLNGIKLKNYKLYNEGLTLNNISDFDTYNITSELKLEKYEDYSFKLNFNYGCSFIHENEWTRLGGINSTNSFNIYTAVLMNSSKKWIWIDNLHTPEILSYLQCHCSFLIYF